MLPQPVIEFTPKRAAHEAVVNMDWVELHRMFAPLPFSCSTFSKSSFCYELALGQRHQSQLSVSVYQSATHCHSCAHAEHGEQYAYQPLRHGTVPQEQGL